jgi:uncharacterized repeat protein (TIGR03803 family)
MVLHSFACPPKGANPYAGVVRDSAGNLYGTTLYGGSTNVGVVYKLNKAGQETVLHAFTGGADGGQSYYGGALSYSAGDIYGTTGDGGAAGLGKVYKLDAAGKETVLYSFTGGADGAVPSAGVILDSEGNLYGTTYSGGGVYKLDAGGNYTVLYSFTGGADGGNPEAGVIRDSAGNLYGTAGGGAAYEGVVYKLDAAGTYTVLYSFTGGADGGNPYGSLTIDSAGNLYGTTLQGGAGWGVVYKVNTALQESVLYSFKGGTDGCGPVAGVVRDSAGNLYGTADACGTANAGVVFKLSKAGSYTVLYSFTGGAAGANPYGGVIRDPAGDLYGTTIDGGSANNGVVYKVDTAGQESVLYSFPPPSDGSYPYAGVIRDSAGNLYGTTDGGGAANQGVVYKLNKAGQETVLYSFTGGADGADPYAGVALDSSGNLYGTTVYGGSSNAGVVYKLDKAGQETVLYSFTGGADGANPYAGVIIDPAGNLYGAASGGGAADEGVVYKLDAAGSYTVLHGFTGGDDGAYPHASLTLDSAGNLYGTTYSGGTSVNVCFSGCGVVYKVNTAGQETVLYSFKGAPDGANPEAGAILDSTGNLYGTTYSGGSANAGVVYKLDTAGQESVLCLFNEGAFGGRPYGGVILDSAGNLYGTTESGGASGAGVVYKLNKSGQETVLYSFTGGADGRNPYAGVILDPAGNLYGTTYSGGKATTGVVFKVKR